MAVVWLEGGTEKHVCKDIVASFFLNNLKTFLSMRYVQASTEPLYSYHINSWMYGVKKTHQPIHHKKEKKQQENQVWECESRKEIMND